jgi:hypothetical protein
VPRANDTVRSVCAAEWSLFRATIMIEYRPFRSCALAVRVKPFDS